MKMRITDEALEKNYPQARAHRFEIDCISMYAVSAGNASKRAIVWIHGSPGSWTAWQDFLKDTSLMIDYFHVFVDRPGFGFSNTGVSEPSLEKQSSLLHALLDSLGVTDSVVILGHSMGGPVAARMVMDDQNRYAALILLAAALDPDLEKIHWYQRLIQLPVLAWATPKELKASNEELIALGPELEKMRPFWKNIQIPVFMIHGLKDNLVDPENVAFVKSELTSAPLEVWEDKEMGHLIPWTHPQMIIRAINKATHGKN